jgi:hypothetical protein
VVKEFDELKAAIEHLAGTTGTAEYNLILRRHEVERPKDFTSPQPARLCAKDVFALLTELRAAASENQEPAAHGDHDAGSAVGEAR